MKNCYFPGYEGPFQRLQALQLQLETFYSQSLQTKATRQAAALKNKAWCEQSGMKGNKCFCTFRCHGEIGFCSLVFANFACISLSKMGGSNGVGSRQRSAAATTTCSAKENQTQIRFTKNPRLRNKVLK